MKFGTVDYVGEGTLQIPPRGAFQQMGEIYAIFLFICIFSPTHPQVRPLKSGIFALNTSNEAVLHKEVPFWG